MDTLLSRLLWLFVGIVLGAIFHEFVLKKTPPIVTSTVYSMTIDLIGDTIIIKQIK